MLSPTHNTMHRTIVPKGKDVKTLSVPLGLGLNIYDHCYKAKSLSDSTQGDFQTKVWNAISNCRLTHSKPKTIPGFHHTARHGLFPLQL